MPFPQNLRITRIIKETSLAKTFYLAAEGGDFEFKAGQYLTLNEEPSNPHLSRNYSLSKAPFENQIAITIKRQDNGYFSRLMIDKKKVNDTVYAIGVFGQFVLPENISNQFFIMFAAGSGIVPIFALIKEILEHQPTCNIALYYSNSSKKETIYYSALEALSASFPERFSIKYFFSQENKIQEARISAFMIPDIVSNYDKEHTTAYLCGPIDYMDTLRMSLLTHGLKKHNIFTEEFSYYTEELENQLIPPPDTTPRLVTINVHNTQHKICTSYPDSILTAALKQNVAIPYSCSSGQCGSCTAILTKGKVWMSYNEVLTDKQIADGLILTCQGFPIEGDVEIAYQ